MESNELISSSRKSSNDSELWDLPGSLEPDTMAGRFPSVCFGEFVSYLLSRMTSIGNAV